MAIIPDHAVSPIDREPLIVEKRRYRLNGSKSSVFYACGLPRDTFSEAEQDAKVFSRLQRLANALSDLDLIKPAPVTSAKEVLGK